MGDRCEMKKSDLYREWARVIDMCDGTKVESRDCWKLMGCYRNTCPDFEAKPGNYEFAVAIIENKPAFAGDVIYHKSGMKYTVSKSVSVRGGLVDFSEYSWSQQKKTFMLNGVELPCPVNNGSTGSRLVVHEFETQEDCNKVLNAINKLLIEKTVVDNIPLDGI